MVDTCEPNSFILRALIEAGDAFVSGESLATSLNLSRVAIWKRIETFNKNGFKIEAIRNQGYRLLQEPEFIHPNLLQAYFDIEAIKHPIHFFETIDSTNTQGQRELVQGSVAPSLVVGKTMTQGKARLGRSWVSSDTGNLYFSFCFRPNFPAQKLGPLPLWIGLCICEWVEKSWGIPLQLKWPNDLLFEGKKLSGMLAEASIDTDLVRSLVFGIGLNVNSNCTLWPKILKENATCLKLAYGKPLPIHTIAAQLAKTVFESYEIYQKSSHLQAIKLLWGKYNALENQFVRAIQGDKTWEGTPLGLDAHGGLILKLTNGSSHTVYAADVTLAK